MRITTYKTHFFKEIDSPEKAWVLGWIYGDGTVYVGKNNGKHLWRITLGEQDKDVLFKMKEILDYPHKIRLSRGKYPMLDVNNKEMVLDLIKQGIPSGKKSKILKPLNLMKDLMPHFWRGVFEADGSVFRDNQNNGYVISMSGNKATCEGFKEFMNWDTKINFSARQHTVRKFSKKYEFWEKIEEKFYGDDVMERGIYLKRKYNILKEFMGELARPA